MSDEIFFIKNTIDERASVISGYFATYKQAAEARESCCDWYGQPGSGAIYKIKLGLNETPELVDKK